MRIGWKTLVAGSALVAVAVLGCAGGQGQEPGVARAEDGNPDLNGIWQAVTTANWDIETHQAEAGPHPGVMGAWGAQPGGMGIVEGGTIPYTLEALAEKQENLENRMVVMPTNDPRRFDTGDPELQCYRPGVPRANYMPFPFQIFQNSEQILITYEYKGAHRLVNLASNEEAPAGSWMGWSNGRWEGDTLVVDVTGFNGLAWFDRAGNFATDALHVVERWTPMGPNHLMYEATIEDPNVYTEPWTISFPIYRRLEPNVQLMEFNCVPFVEEIMYTPLGLYNPPAR
ncbi:MAG: hypothetical protein O7I93_00475 [Gemmatimonadetes bacterium]|nr:hypothetical protein [Gemmatimonadota bacterium]